MSNPKDRDTPVVGPDKNARLRPRVDDQLTTKKAVDDWTSINGPLRPNSEEGINTRFAKVVGIEKDPANFDMNHHAEMVDALSGQPPVRYKVIVEGAAGQIFVPPEGFGGTTPEDKIVNDSLDDFGLNNANVPALNVGDTVAVDYANSSTKQGGFITSKVSKYSDGSGTLREKRKKITSPSSNFADKKPQTGVKRKLALANKPPSQNDPIITPSTKIDINILEQSNDIWGLIFRENDEWRKYHPYLSRLLNVRISPTEKLGLNTFGALSLCCAAMKFTTKGLTTTAEKLTAEQWENAVLGGEYRFSGRGLMYKYFKGEQLYKRFGNIAGHDFVEKKQENGTSRRFFKAFDVATDSKLAVYSAYYYLYTKNFHIYGNSLNTKAAWQSALTLDNNEPTFHYEVVRIYEKLKQYPYLAEKQ